MAGWTDSSPTSRIFTQAVLNPIGRMVASTTGFPTTYAGLVADALVKAALFNNTPSPDASVAVASTGYNTGVWITANEVIDSVGPGTNWAAGGRALASKVWSVLTAGSQTTASAISFSAANLAGAGNVTIAGAFGCLVYDGTITAGTVAAQGMCFNYFGGTQSVTAGTFTIVWDATGVFKITN
jgi:hypothetical protein